jgi:hypothetical protein
VLDVRDASGEHEAVAPAPQRGAHVGDESGVACFVQGEGAVRCGDHVRSGWFPIVGAELERGLVDVEQASGYHVRLPGLHERCGCRKPRLRRSSGMFVFVDDAAEVVTSTDVQVRDCGQIGDRFR